MTYFYGSNIYVSNNRVLNIPGVASEKNFRPDDLEMKRVFFVPNSNPDHFGIWNEENPFHFKIIGAKIFEFFFHWPVYVYLTVFYRIRESATNIRRIHQPLVYRLIT
jgi:hypothetical protein